MPQISARYVELMLKDGNSNETEMELEGGVFQWTQAKNVIYTYSKGRMSTTRLGDEVPIELSANFVWGFLLGGSEVTPYEALNFIGGAADWVSSDTEDPCATPRALDLEVTQDLQCSAEQTEVYLFNFFRDESQNPQLDNGVVAVSGKCRATAPTVTRV